MNFFFELPVPVRLAMVFLAGTIFGTQVNRGVYRLAWHPRHIGPWSPADPQAPPRSWFDRVPIFGWLTLARESKLHGPGFWLRPLFIELLMGVGLAALYWWEVVKSGLTPQLIEVSFGPAVFLPLQTPAALHAQFFSHVILIVLMATASFIDIDEKLIPDTITLPGTLLGLLLGALLPSSHLPIPMPTGTGGWTVSALEVPSPHFWSPWMDGPRGLAIGLACYAAWWFAILNWFWHGRRGFVKALTYVGVTLKRRVWPRKHRPREGSPLVLALLLGGLAAIAAVWLVRHSLGIDSWRGLLSSLVGMAFGGGLVWAVRIIGTAALRKEAMGFGDVTLVAMIGAFLGWQPCLMLFFIAPFAGLIIALGQLAITRRSDIWYGPFLCLGALVTVVAWAWLWTHYGSPIFWLGWIVPGMLVSCLVLMGGMLAVWRMIKEAFLYGDEEQQPGR